MRAIFEYSVVPRNNFFFFFRKTFVQFVTFWLVWMRTYKNADEKEHTFLWRRNVQNEQRGRKTDTV